MNFSEGREKTKQKILSAVAADPRIVGCLDYGSSGESRDDQWSDLDFALFIRDAEIDQFWAEWKEWVAQFGDIYLAYISGVGHPWAVLDIGAEMPLRVDLNFFPDSQHDVVVGWPNSPTGVGSMVLYDDTADARLSSSVSKIVGQSLAPEDLGEAFEKIGGDFWYYLIRTHVKLLRQEYWCARHDFNFIIVGNLLALLRIECGAVDQMRGASAAAKIEQVLDPRRLAQLDGCIPDATPQGIARSLQAAAVLGAEVCRAISALHGWPWPERLASQIVRMLDFWEGHDNSSLRR